MPRKEQTPKKKTPKKKTEKSLFISQKAFFKPEPNTLQVVLATMVRKGLVGFYKLRVFDHFGKKGARRRDQPYGGGFFGRWRSSDLRSAKKATPYSLINQVGGQIF